jgi:hypothetical protein
MDIQTVRMIMEKVTEINAITGEVIERPMNDEELAQRKKDQEQAEKLAAAKAKELADKAIAKSVLLERLGITADEAKLLLS